MPELPEVECVRRTLAPHLLGVRVVGVRVRRADVCECWNALGRCVRLTGRRLLAGQRIAGVERHGKQLAIVADSGAVVCVHMGMTGQLCVHGGAPARAHEHVTWLLDSGATLSFRDPRRFGGVWTFPSMALLRARRWSELGPDALTLTGDHLAVALQGSTRAVKAALLDQSVAAGIGNIYADEALFRAGIDPRTRCSRIPVDALHALANAVRDVLGEAVARGGSTLRDYVDANGEQGGAQAAHLVYGRGGEACVRCSARLRQATVAQRTTVWCPACQGRL